MINPAPFPFCSSVVEKALASISTFIADRGSERGGWSRSDDDD